MSRATADLIALDPAGQVAGTYPLSAAPTRHRVRMDQGPALHAMCAVYALGIPAMLSRAALITSTDPSPGQSIKAHVDDDDDGGVVDPPDAVALPARAGYGPLASACCSIVDFHVDRAAALHALARLGVHGTVLSISEATASAPRCSRRCPPPADAPRATARHPAPAWKARRTAAASRVPPVQAADAVVPAIRTAAARGPTPRAWETTNTLARIHR